MKRIFIMWMLVSLTGCQWIADYNYRFREGQHLHAKQIAKITVGQSQQDVLAVLGAPLYRHTFSSRKWYYMTHAKEYQQHRTDWLVIEFNRDNTVRKITRS